MNWYAIDAQAPLVFRSARPFGAGSRDGANFPWPSSLAGMVRTRAMDRLGWTTDLTAAQQTSLLEIAVRGPLPARRENGRLAVYVPRPADAVLLADPETANSTWMQLQPSQRAPGTGDDLPAGLLPLHLAAGGKGKPQAAPSFWPLSDLLAWGTGNVVSARTYEPSLWETERRTHVAIERSTQAARDGQLFQTEGLELGRRRIGDGGRSAGYSQHDWLLLAATSEPLSEGLATFGGERRLSWLAAIDVPELDLPPELPETCAHGFALTLITPALFDRGWCPGWLDDHLTGTVPGIAGLRVRLRAAAVDRWRSVSGWDLAAWKPRAARKAVPAGATYWFEVLAGDADALAKLWMTCISDDAQDRRDGFGLAIPRPWNALALGESQAC
jgi:CRISPR-associated protein Cmr3